MSRFANDFLSTLSPYVPGEQPQENGWIKLNTNESPYPPSPRVLDALHTQQAQNLSRYPDPTAKNLVEVIATYYHVQKENVFVSNGSDETLAFCYLAFCQNGVCCPAISYGFYPVFAELFQVPYETVPLSPMDLSIKPESFFHKNKSILLANPNAPTGTALTLEQLEQILKNNPNQLVMIDEAYVDFGAQSAVVLTQHYDNLLVIQTCSKSRSLAGARLGFAIGHSALIQDLNRIKFSFNPYNLNRMTIQAGIAAFLDVDYFQATTQSVVNTREKTKRRLQHLGFHVFDSLANFLFVSHESFSGQTLYEALKQEKILVRTFQNAELTPYVRISIGTDSEMAVLIHAIEEIISTAK